MKKDNVVRKLYLGRETIQPLTAQQLEDVAGGATPAIIIAGTVGLSLVVAVTKK